MKRENRQTFSQGTRPRDCLDADVTEQWDGTSRYTVKHVAVVGFTDVVFVLPVASLYQAMQILQLIFTLKASVNQLTSAGKVHRKSESNIVVNHHPDIVICNTDEKHIQDSIKGC